MPETLFTPAAAAVATGVPVKAVQALADRGILADVVVHRDHKRQIPKEALAGLKTAYALADLLTPALRRELVRQAAAHPRRRRLRLSDLLTVDMRSHLAAVQERLRLLDRALDIVVVDPRILDGTPVLRGTRIPVHDVASLIATGETPETVRRHYPRLTDEHIELAPIYAQAYPLRGRPKRLRWPRKHKVKSTRRHRKALPHA